MKRRMVLIVLAALIAIPLAAGCMGRTIEEDYYAYDLPEIDPEDGVEKEIPATLYYRLNDEECLAPVQHGVRVTANERSEAAVIRALIAGVPPDAHGVSALFPEGVQVTEVSYEGGILYVTLSKEMLDASAPEQIDRNDYAAEEEYAAAVEAERAEMYLKRRLAVISIVDTIVDSSEDNELKVQIMIDADGSGKGSRVTYAELGFEGYDEELIEPLGFQQDAVATPKRIAECLFAHLVKGEYDPAYALIAGGEGFVKPDYQSFAAELQSLGRVIAYTVNDVAEEQHGITVTVDVRYANPEGIMIQVSNALLSVSSEDGFYRIGYESLRDIMVN